MRTVFPLIFYPWLFVSLFVLARRRVRRRSDRRGARDVTATTRSVDDTQAAVLARLAEAGSPAPAGEPDGVPGEDAPTDASEVGEEGPSLHRPATGPDLTSISIPPPSEFRTLAELVRGIAMPCDLTPHFGGGALVADRAAFVTSTHTADDVEQALQDELSRLGLKTIDPTSYGFMARGDRGTVEVRIYPNAALATADGSTTFAGARANSVAVELVSR